MEMITEDSLYSMNEAAKDDRMILAYRKKDRKPVVVKYDKNEKCFVTCMIDTCCEDYYEDYDLLGFMEIFRMAPERKKFQYDIYTISAEIDTKSKEPKNLLVHRAGESPVSAALFFGREDFEVIKRAIAFIGKNDRVTNVSIGGCDVYAL